jgi:hypothetical protein
VTDTAPLVWVDLVYDEPMTLVQFWRRPDPGFCDDIEEAWQRYKLDYQPWSLVVRVGDDPEPLFRSTKSYRDKTAAEQDAETVFGRGSSVYLRQPGGAKETLRMAEDHPLSW